eukprot:CAMPEP_0195130180 /NCGR_PEP_ID=MMETSP0448-20130528/142760_1 /TAXON_ID=66468 /ORGANISM="Heterocapsa triquestra, Strain CCMP 448" /LENGTH=157 /DNA_ID=CAMNT_0040168073 /DNA_START=9 /DNA_END=482 /DNA_ORIENTATION=-
MARMMARGLSIVVFGCLAAASLVPTAWVAGLATRAGAPALRGQAAGHAAADSKPVEAHETAHEARAFPFATMLSAAVALGLLFGVLAAPQASSAVEAPEAKKKVMERTQVSSTDFATKVAGKAQTKEERIAKQKAKAEAELAKKTIYNADGTIRGGY